MGKIFLWANPGGIFSGVTLGKPLYSTMASTIWAFVRVMKVIPLSVEGWIHRTYHIFQFSWILPRK